MPLRTRCLLPSPWIALLGLVALPMGCADAPSAAAKKAADKKPVPVETVSVEQMEVQRTSIQPATVRPYYQAEIRSKVPGYVRELNADIGDYVEAGAVLAVVDVPELKKQREVIDARVQRLQAKEKQAEAGVALAEANITAVKAQIDEARSQLAQAEATLAAADAELSRVRDLVGRQSLEQRVLDESQKRRDAAQASTASAESAIQSAQAQVVVAEAQLTAAKADVDAARAETEVARKEAEELDVSIDYATIKSPFAGVVTSRTVDPGDLVREASGGSSGEPLFVVSQIDKVRIHVSVPEAEAAIINPGDQVTLTFPSFPAEQLTAQVSRVAQSLASDTRTMRVEAEFGNKERKLLPGMFGQGSIVMSTQVAANVLPARAVRFRENGQAYVYVVGSEGTVEVTEVTTGLDDGNSIEILSGVEAGDRVVGAHLQRFTDGQRVAPLQK